MAKTESGGRGGPTMNVPDEALEAAARRLYADECKAVDEARGEHGLRPKRHPAFTHLGKLKADTYRDKARPAVEAAAPHIAAQALRRVAETGGSASSETLASFRQRLSIMDRERINLVSERDAMIRCEHETGATIADLARATGLTRTMLYKIISR